MTVSKKSRTAVVLLCFFFGCFGIHRFYLGKIGSGLLMLFTFGGLGIWALIDFILAICGELHDSDGLLVKNW